MFRRTLGTALIAAVMVAALGAPSASAMFWNGDENGYPVFSGKVGQFAGPAGPEVTCRYTAAGRLRSVTVHPPAMWGNYNQASYVGWRYQLRIATAFEAGALVYKSPTWKGVATKTTATGDFTSKRFYVRSNADEPGTTAYYVAPVMLWYAKGSSRTVEGRAPVVYDGYLLRRGAESRWSNGCAFDYTLDWEG